MNNPETTPPTGAPNPLTPLRYNILLTREGKELAFEFPPATADLITRYGYLLPHDVRCAPGLVQDEADLYRLLEPVLGKGYHGSLSYHTRKQVIVSLHDTAILGYQRQSIIDPRLTNEVANFWEIYLDQRVFPQALDESWQQLLAEMITTETTDADADRKLAEDIKSRLLEQAQDDDTE